VLWPKDRLVLVLERETAARIDGENVEDALVRLARHDAGAGTFRIDEADGGAAGAGGPAGPAGPGGPRSPLPDWRKTAGVGPSLPGRVQ
jgi:hypothetical protein